MKYLHCTQKLLKEINGPVTDLKDITPDNQGIGNWYCNLFRFNRRKCLILTNEKSLYTFFVYGVKKNDIDSLPQLFRENFRLNLKLSGFDDKIIDMIIAEYSETGFCKTASKSVLGIMNDFVNCFGYMMPDNADVTEEVLLHACMQVNKMPMSAIKYRYPVKVMKDLIDETYILRD